MWITCFICYREDGRSSASVANSNSEMDQSEELVSRYLDHNIDWCTATILTTGAAVQTETVPQSMFTKVDKFYVCVQCGKVFWEGSHFEKVCEQFSHVLNMQHGEPSVADQLNSHST